MRPTTRRAPPAGHLPRKRFGQHFLASAWAEKAVRAIAPQPGDVFLEIGPGTGALTLPLAATGVPILAVEIDRDLVKHLAGQLPSHVTLVSGDFLTTDVMGFLTGLQPQRTPAGSGSPEPPRRFRVVGNLPYNLTSPILFRLIELQQRHGLFADACLMMQREVAERVTAKVGTKAYGVMSILLARHTRATRLLDLPPGAFSPPPKVRSSIVRLAFGTPEVRVSDERLLEQLVKAMFLHRRKTLGNALRSFDATAPAVLALAQIDPRRRPETLQVSEIARLAELFASIRRTPVL